MLTPFQLGIFNGMRFTAVGVWIIGVILYGFTRHDAAGAGLVVSASAAFIAVTFIINARVPAYSYMLALRAENSALLSHLLTSDGRCGVHGTDCWIARRVVGGIKP